MRPFTSFLITLAIFKTVLSDCCSHVYLYSSDVIADFNQFSLGIYTYEGQFNNRPYFAKTAYVPSAPPTTVKFFLAYLDNGKNALYCLKLYLYLTTLDSSSSMYCYEAFFRCSLENWE